MHNAPQNIHTAALYFTGRLTKSLTAISDSSLTLVEAPMGYGKTVAVREYLRKRRTRAIWVSVLNSGEDAFWRDFCRAVARSFPDSLGVVESLSRLGYPRDAVRVAAAREILLQLDFTPKTVLVVDDIHLLSNGKGGGMGALCALLARQGPEALRLVLISRDRWTGDEREVLFLKKLLAVVDRETLALNAREIAEYYALCGLHISPKNAAALRAATGGWISALYLYLLRYSKDGKLARPAAIGSLLEKEIFSPLPESSKKLLLALSPLERFTGEQAEFLLGEGGGAREVLADLLQKNSFIAHDEESDSYTLHSLLRQYLRERFEQLPEERRTAAHSKAADWFILQKEAIPAIEACHAAGEHERALEVLESDMSRNLVTEKSRFFVELFQACPEEVLERHMGAAFKYAIAAFTSGDYDSFASQLAWIHEKCVQKAAEKGEQDPETRIWRGELELLLSFRAYNDIKAMSVHHRRANDFLQRPTKLFGPESPWTLGCPSVLFMFHKTCGALDEELAHMDECLPHYYALTSMHGAGGEHQMRAEALYQRGEFDQATAVCHRAEAMARAHGQLSLVLCSLFLRMRLAAVRGKPAEAEELIKKMRGMIRERRDFFLLHTVDLCECWLRSVTGPAEQIPEWVRFDLEGENRLYTFAGGYYYIAHGRALLLAGEHAALAGLFAWLMQSGAFGNHLLFSLYAHLYMAAGNAALGMDAEADTSLRTALNLALPDKLYMPFAENADLLPPLRGLEHDPLLGEGVANILRLASILDKSRNIAARSASPVQKPPLTKRELQFAQMAASGLQYKEIAASLGLAPSTVKRAFASMYKKLGLNSREQLKAYLAGYK